MSSSRPSRRLLLLTSKLGYQTRSFVEAAEKLGMQVVFGSDRCHQLDDPWGDGAIALKFEDAEESSRRVIEVAMEAARKEGRPCGFDAVVSLGDRPTPIAARVCQTLGLPHHPPVAADQCRDKYRSREVLRSAGLNVPSFTRFPLDTPPATIAEVISETLGYPYVLKPLALSGSRGVIRADNSREAAGAFERIRALLLSPEVRVLREETSEFIQVEQYIEGEEVAVEALMERGHLQVLAIFDKPDALTGPFFEETIYTTPSRLAAETQREIVRTLEQAVKALGLFHGPVHAELRLNERGVWPLEIAARCIGGVCSRALRFVRRGDAELMSLEEVLIRLALAESMKEITRESAAAGVMMVPIPRDGVYHSVEGVREAEAIPGIDEIQITAKPEQKLVPLPEGGSYLGFIFARGERPEQVETALRAAHSKLRFVIGAALPVL
jgi:predicted ATP-grasp superfamily ATP-dependent carboligase